MNIAMAFMRKIGGSSGGMANILCQFSNAMVQRGHCVCLIIDDNTGKPPFFPLDDKVKIFNLHDKPHAPDRIPFYRKPSRELYRMRGMLSTWYENYRMPYAVEALLGIYKEFKPDVLINYHYSGAGFIYKSNPPCPVITMLHGIPDDVLRRSTPLELGAMDHSAVFQVLLPGYIPEARKYLPHVPFVSIPNEVPQFKNITDVGAKKEVYRIINVARINKREKQQHVLLEAFAQLAEEFPQWELNFWGEGNITYLNEMKQLAAEHHLENRVFFRGTTHHIHEEYMKSDIFALPSAYEGFPLAMTEAMSHGLPVVAFRSCEAAKEIIQKQNAGLLVPDGVDSFAKGLHELMADQKRRVKLGRKAHEAMAEFAPSRIWDQWEELMQTVVH